MTQTYCRIVIICNIIEVSLTAQPKENQLTLYTWLKMHNNAFLSTFLTPPKLPQKGFIFFLLGDKKTISV